MGRRYRRSPRAALTNFRMQNTSWLVLFGGGFEAFGVKPLCNTPAAEVGSDSLALIYYKNVTQPQMKQSSAHFM